MEVKELVCFTDLASYAGRAADRAVSASRNTARRVRSNTEAVVAVGARLQSIVETVAGHASSGSGASQSVISSAASLPGGSDTGRSEQDPGQRGEQDPAQRGELPIPFGRPSDIKDFLSDIHNAAALVRYLVEHIAIYDQATFPREFANATLTEHYKSKVYWPSVKWR